MGEFRPHTDGLVPTNHRLAPDDLRGVRRRRIPVRCARPVRHAALCGTPSAADRRHAGNLQPLALMTPARSALAGALSLLLSLPASPATLALNQSFVRKIMDTATVTINFEVDAYASKPNLPSVD